MVKIAVIGTQGMLGSAVCRYLSNDDFQIIEINTTGKTQSNNSITKFDISSESINNLKEVLRNVSFVVNCAGLIKHKIEENNLKSVNNLIRVNSIFPIELTELAQELGFRVIQIATDCVFSGDKGSYAESDTKDPIDNYGYSKVLGEHQDKNLITLRCSLVGKELNSKIEFLEWVLSHGEGSEVGGYTDHLWNGLTTMHYAKIISGIMKRNHFSAGTFHIVPEGSVSKYQLSQVILECFGSSHINVVPIQSPKSVNRTLATDNVQFNLDMWRDAGYNKPLNVAEMIREYSLWV